MVKGSIATRRNRNLLKLVPALLLLAGLSLTAQHASAQTTYNVNTTADTHNTGGTTCSDLNGRCSLRAAVEAADTLAAGSVAYINVPAGHYVLKLNLSLILNGNNTVFITGAGSARTIVDGNCLFFAIVLGGFSVFQNGTTLGFPDPTDADNLTMSDLEITNGCADNGGAILNGGNMSLIRVHITRNAANFDGGGVNLSNDFFPTTITDSTIDFNVAYEAGGGIWNDETLTLRNDHVDNNAAVTESLVVGTDGAEGGGVYNGNTLTASNDTFNQNQAVDLLPGGKSSSIVTNTIKGKAVPGFGRFSVTSKGGALFSINDQADVTGSQFYYNEAGLGGAVFNADRLTLNNDRLNMNKAGCAGGATYNVAPLQVDDTVLSGPGQLYMSTDIVGSNVVGYAGEDCFYFLIDSPILYAPKPFTGGGSYNDGTETIAGAQYERNYILVPPITAKKAGITARDGVLLDPSPCGFEATCGGGIYSGGIITITDTNPSLQSQDLLTRVRFVGNQAQVGGGLFHEYGTANIQTSVFAANRATVGGGIADFFNYFSIELPPTGSAHLLLSSTFIQGNVATQEAGGVFNLIPDQVLTNQGTIVGNYAPVCPNWLNGPTGTLPYGTPPFDPSICS